MIECADKAHRLSPRDPILWVFYFVKGLAYSMLNESAQALDLYRRVMAMAPEFANGQRALAAELALNGQVPEAREALQHYLSMKDARIRTIAQEEAAYGVSFSGNPTYRAWRRRFEEGLRQAGMPEE
jgi:tetratricopeptide (TPR) repeat protein